MKRVDRMLVATFLLGIASGTAVPDDSGDAVVDPFAVIAELDRFAGLPLWPGFDPSVQPAAVYDGERTLLRNHPDPPEGFAPLEGHDDLWVQAGRHPLMRSNSTVELGGVRTATLMLTLQPGRSVAQHASNLVHETFHVFSKPRHPTWRPDEMQRYSYPLDDAENFTLLLLEEEALARALEAGEDAAAAGWGAAALGFRRQRTPRLAEEHRAFETALEMQEGTAVHVARLALGTPRDTSRLRRFRPPGMLRWRFYDTGAALAALLDRLAPGWKERIEAEPAATMDALLEQALQQRGTEAARLPASESRSIGQRAQQAVGELTSRWKTLRNELLSRAPRVVVIVPDGAEPLRLRSFDPLALEVLDGGEALHPHRLALERPDGQIEVENPRFQRGSLQGVVSLTAPAGTHPLLQGVRSVTVAGFTGGPEVASKDGVITIEAEGLRLRFQGASIHRAGEEIRLLLQPSASPDG